MERATKLKRRKADHHPVTWSSHEEVRLLTYLRRNALDSEKLQELFPDRSWPSIRSKVRKLRIKHDLFGSSYRDDKEDFTTLIAKKTKAKVVFDAYAGAGHQAFKWIEHADIVYASEIMKSKIQQFSKSAKSNNFKKLKPKGNWQVFKKASKAIYLYMGDALEAIVELKSADVKIDLVDLDTCGSTLPLLPTVLLLLKPRHLVITHGEFHSMRFNRQDVLRRLFVHRDISQNPLPLEVEQLSSELDKAVKLSALRAHNETAKSFWLVLRREKWLGSKYHGMLRRYYKVQKPAATADCINELSKD
nr:hypothetical protein [uncultured Sediminibacterium sp.]